MLHTTQVVFPQQGGTVTLIMLLRNWRCAASRLQLFSSLWLLIVVPLLPEVYATELLTNAENEHYLVLEKHLSPGECF